MKHWLMTIRQGRILLDPTRLIHDEFEHSKSLQQWIGIAYEITDKEAQPILYDAIQTELNIGIGNLPLHHYEQHFNITLTELLNKPLEEQKLWFKRVRQGRVIMDPTNLTHDEFMNPGMIQAWIQFD